MIFLHFVIVCFRNILDDKTLLRSSANSTQNTLRLLKIIGDEAGDIQNLSDHFGIVERVVLTDGILDIADGIA